MWLLEPKKVNLLSTYAIHALERTQTLGYQFERITAGLGIDHTRCAVDARRTHPLSLHLITLLQLSVLSLALTLNAEPGVDKSSDAKVADSELRRTAFNLARPSISNLLANIEKQIGMQLAFIPLPDKDPVAARFIFDTFRNEPRIQLRKNWEDVDVAHEAMHAQMDLIEGFSMLAWRRDVPRKPEIEAAFGRLQTYVKDEVVHAKLAKLGLRMDGEIIRPSLFDSVYANAARYLDEGRDRPNDGMAHLDKLGYGTLCRVCFLIQAELLLKNYRAQLPQHRIEQTERFIRTFRAHRPEESEKANAVLELFRKNDVQNPTGHREILTAWTKMEGLEKFVGPSSYRKITTDRYILPFPE
jgi:hypothetical protein